MQAGGRGGCHFYHGGYDYCQDDTTIYYYEPPAEKEEAALVIAQSWTNDWTPPTSLTKLDAVTVPSAPTTSTRTPASAGKQGVGTREGASIGPTDDPSRRDKSVGANPVHAHARERGKARRGSSRRCALGRVHPRWPAGEEACVQFGCLGRGQPQLPVG